MTISDIEAKISFYTKTNTASFPASDRLIAENNAYNHVAALINQCDDRWQWDDNNNTDLPIATAALVSGQQDYQLSNAHLSIDRVEIKNTTGYWTLLDPIDQHDIKYQALAQYLSVAGTPLQYDKIGSSIFLYPTPNYSQAASLKLYYTRGPAEFTSGDVSTGTKQPGFNSLFHDLIPLWVAYDYSVANGLPSATGFYNAIQVKEKELVDFYGLRSRDERGRFTVSTNGQTGNTSGRINYGNSDSNM